MIDRQEVTSPQEKRIMATVTAPPQARTEQRLRLSGIDWKTYSRLLRAFQGRRLVLPARVLRIEPGLLAQVIFVKGHP